MCFTEVLIKLVFKEKSQNLIPSWKLPGYCKVICLSRQTVMCSFFGYFCALIWETFRHLIYRLGSFILIFDPSRISFAWGIQKAFYRFCRVFFVKTQGLWEQGGKQGECCKVLVYLDVPHLDFLPPLAASSSRERKFFLDLATLTWKEEIYSTEPSSRVNFIFI